MQLALASRSLGTAHPLDEDIRIAAITGFPWLVLDHGKLDAFLQDPDFDIRDLKRLFLRTKPAAIDALYLPDCDPAHLPQVEALCREGRRLGAPVLVARIAQPDERLAAFAEVAQGWSTVLALASSHDCPYPQARALVASLDHPALGLHVAPVELWEEGSRPAPEDARRTVLLAVGDVDESGAPVLPGEGVVPLRELLAPLHEGGYDSLAVLGLEGTDVPLNPEALAGAGQRALAELLNEVGWTVGS